MGLEEFKFIYWMEYAHRMWGRALGLIFTIPAMYFVVRGQLNRPLSSRLLILFTMGGAQGFVGWWMVRSGLQPPENEHDVPRVSPYRLAAHLGAAFTIYATLVWTTLTLLYPQSPTMLASGPQAAGARLLRGKAHMLAALVGATVASGWLSSVQMGCRARHVQALDHLALCALLHMDARYSVC
jgi:heme a synthase